MGAIHSQIFVADFVEKNKTVAISGISIDGPLVIWGGKGPLPNQTNLLYNATYSNTATTVTFMGPAYNVLYGPESNGIALSFVFNHAVNLCTISGTAIRQ